MSLIRWWDRRWLRVRWCRFTATNLATQTADRAVTAADESGGNVGADRRCCRALYYVSPGQIDAQIPFELKPGSSIRFWLR